MSNPQQESDERGVRKSKRQRVPNQYYTAGINQLKKITLKGQSKKSRADDEDQYSSDQERNNNSNNYRHAESYNSYQKIDQAGSWIPCILPNNKQLKVQIVIDSYQMEFAKVKQEPIKQAPQPVFLPSFNSGPVKKTENSSLNLLSLFQQAIKNVADQIPSPVKNNRDQSLYHSASLQQPTLKYQQSNQKPAKMAVLAPPKRVIEEDIDGKILSLVVDRQSKLMKINHSKMGLCQIPIEVVPPNWNNQEEQNEEQKIDEFRRKIAQNQFLLKNIPIFN